MRFAVETWATEYGTPMEVDERDESKVKVDVEVERAAARWEPLSPSPSSEPQRILFTDGVRRIEARVWIETDGGARPGVCASYAAGGMLCDGRATLTDPRVERGLFTAVTDASPITGRHARYELRRAEGDRAEQLWIAIQGRMGEVEGAIAADADAELVIVDGPLKGNLVTEGCDRVGYVKTHHVSYLTPELEKVVAELRPGQRTPLFLTLGRWGRFSWYMRLPGAEAHAWSGVVRCETTCDRELTHVTALADRVTAALPRYASTPHKDGRAPQNLFPIAGLERELRRRLGDPLILYRDLRQAAAANGAA